MCRLFVYTGLCALCLGVKLGMENRVWYTFTLIVSRLYIPGARLFVIDKPSEETVGLRTNDGG
jgi:hypothetical protein